MNSTPIDVVEHEIVVWDFKKIIKKTQER